MSAPPLDTAALDWLPAGFRIHSVPTNGTRLSVAVAVAVAVGGTGPTVVLLHGWPQTGRARRRVLPALARDHTVVVPDLRGTGASERPDSGYAKTDQADDMRGVLTELGLPGPARPRSSATTSAPWSRSPGPQRTPMTWPRSSSSTRCFPASGWKRR